GADAAGRAGGRGPRAGLRPRAARHRPPPAPRAGAVRVDGLPRGRALQRQPVRRLLGGEGAVSDLRAAWEDEARNWARFARGHDRSLEAVCGAFTGAGLLIDAVREPVPDDAAVADHPELSRARERAALLHLRAARA